MALSESVVQRDGGKGKPDGAQLGAHGRGLAQDALVACGVAPVALLTAEVLSGSNELRAKPSGNVLRVLFHGARSG